MATAPIKTPTATYRLQLRQEFSLADASAAVPYLRLLGVSDLYLSPLHTARPGSVHGYDVVDHARLNPELGDDATLRQLLDAAHAAGLGVVVDIVPNHMCIAGDMNAQWMDVLAEGRDSASAAYFDIDWDPPKPELVGKVLLPFLGEQYGRVLESALSVRLDDGRLFAIWNQQRLPLRAETWHFVLEPALDALKRGLSGDDNTVIELESILRALAQTLPPLQHVPTPVATDAGTHPGTEPTVAYQHEKEAIRLRIVALLDHSPAVAGAITDALRAINGTPGLPLSFDRMERLMDEQFYRLANWRVAAYEINYRRFFDINELAAIRVEDARVFTNVHAIPFAIATHPAFTGFRIDHVDGLSDPQQYLHDLGSKCCEARGIGSSKDGRPFVVVEKILGPKESLPSTWMCDGTTGYDFIPLVGDILTWAPGNDGLRMTANAFAGATQRLPEIAYESKRLVLGTTLAAELTVLARRLDRISEQHRYTRDFTLNHLQQALGEIIACFPVYRTYVRHDDTAVAEADATVIRRAIAAARRRNPLINVSLFDFIESVLLRQDPPGLTVAQIEDRRTLMLRFQQLTGPVVAKGIEDTAFYRYLPLIALNEVGSDPTRIGLPTSAIHDALTIRRADAPRTLSATATHDTKRGEDTRARLYVLSEVAEQWSAATAHWSALNACHKTNGDGTTMPDAAEELLLYQTLVGAWPLGGLASDPQFTDRICAYMTKARHEAKVHTSWINPDVIYDAAAESFVDAVLDPKRSAAFLDSMNAFVGTIANAGLWNSLAQVVLKIAAPGIPDFFQGTELWDFSLVDPDNRRLVDFEHRRRLLTESFADVETHGAKAITAWFDAPADGRIKLWTTAAALALRRARRSLFDHGTYVPLFLRGPRADHAFAFARIEGADAIIAVVGRYFAVMGADRPTGDAWGPTELIVPPELAGRRFRDALTRQTVDVRDASDPDQGAVPLATLFERLPVALLETIA
jgi:(1->4)-alpha-D-glucan 1-alpha-D-glucosylmutase